jgi:hypothetical protein
MPEDYGIKIAKKNKSARSKDRLDHAFNSALATYMVVRKIPVTVNADPYVVIHNLGYVPKAFVYQVLSDHNRKLPYNDDSLNSYDFSITKNEIKIRGISSGSFVIYIFAQPVL